MTGNSSAGALPETGIIGDRQLTGSALSSRRITQEQQAYKTLSDYMNSHNYGRGDFDVYSKDPKWVALHKAAFPQSDFHNNPNASKARKDCAFAALVSYMSDHNYGIKDQSTYMRDPDWQQIFRDVYPESLLPIQGFIKDINPNFDPYVPDPYHFNCGSCALAVEERLNGKNPTAFAGLYGVDTIDKMESATGGKMIFTSKENIEKMLREKGPGSHLIVGIGRRKSCGHFFNVFYDGHDVHIIDGQIGRVLDWSYDYGDVVSWGCVKI